MTWPQPAFPHQDRDHHAIEPQQFPPPGQQDLPALHETQEASRHLSVHPTIPQDLGSGLVPHPTLSLNQFPEARVTMPLIKRKKGPPGNVPARTTACLAQDIRLETIWGWRGKNQEPLKDTGRSAAHCRSEQNILKISYCCLEISTKILGIHQTKNAC